MKVGVPILFLLLCLSIVYSKKSSTSLADDINMYLETGVATPKFDLALDMLRLQTPYKSRQKKLDIKLMEGRAGSRQRRVSCGICHLGVNIALIWVRAGDSREQIVEKALNTCTLFNLQTKEVCLGFIESHVDLFLHIVSTRKEMKMEVNFFEVCGLALYPECGGLNNNHYDWSLDLDFMGPKPEVVEPQLPPAGAATMQVLQLTDVHVDLRYEPGSNAACLEPTCCHGNQVEEAKRKDAAGYWGDYRDCDTPLHAFTDLVEQAKKSHPDVAYVMFTGDAVDHAMWVTGVESNTEAIALVLEEIRDNFPDVPLLPVLGNHEPHPLNVFVEDTGLENIPANISTEWLYELAADTWGAWLPGVRDTIFRGGFYQHEVRPGLLAVVLNNNVCYHYNWWLLVNNKDPNGQLVWLAETLLAAEGAGQKVHILAHIAGNSPECFAPWRREYQRIIDRFENTVVAQFHGHSHNDHFSIFYDLANSSRPNNVAWTAGSATAYVDLNPNYRVYTVDDTDSFRVLDHETWFYNLTEANLAGFSVPPNWRKLYSFREEYGVDSLLPAELDGLVRRMAADTDLLKKYHGNYVRHSDAAIAAGCDNKCLRDLLCEIVSTDPSDLKRCRALPKARRRTSPRVTLTTTPRADSPGRRALENLLI